MSPELLLVLAIFLVCFALILTNFSLSLYVLLVLSVLLHKELFSFFRWDLLPVRAFMVALLCAGIVRLYLAVVRARSFRFILEFFKNPFYVLLGALWLVRGASIYFSRNQQESLLLFAFFTTIVVLGIMLFNYLAKSEDKPLRYIKFYGLLVFLLSLFGYVQLFLYEKFGIIVGALWNVPNNVPRVGATFWDVNHYGALVTALLPVLGVFFLVEKKLRAKLCYLAMLVPMTGALLLTNSRTAWMMAFFTFVSFITIQLVKRIGFKGIGYVITVLVLISIPLLWQYSIKSSPFRARVKQYFHYRLDSFDSHFMLLAGALEIYARYPVLGGGYGSFFEHFGRTKIAPTYFSRDPAALNTRVPPHTIWGELIAETGTLGFGIFFLLWLFIIATLLYAGVTVRDKSKSMLATAMASVFIGWSVAGIFYSYNSEFFWLIIVLYLSYGVAILGGLGYLGNMLNVFVRSQKLIIGVLVSVALVLIFGGLGSTHLVPWDEAIYAKIAKNMAVGGDFLVQHWAPLTVWYEKPPFYMWAAATSVKIFDVTSFAVRLPSAIFGLATVILVFAIGKRLFNKTAGFISAIVLLTTVHFLYYARASMLDVTTTFFITLSVYLYFLARGQQRRSLFMLSGIAAGFATMTKGVVGLLPFPILFIFEVTQPGNLCFAKFKNLVTAFTSAAVVFLPWHLLMLAKFGPVFLQNYIGYHVWDRATTVIEDKGNPFWWYVIVLKVSMRVWFVVLAGALPLAVYRAIKKDKTITLLLIWSIFIFTFFSVAKSKLIWYIIPVYPPLALLVGYFIERSLAWLMQKIPFAANLFFKAVAIYALVMFSLMYLVINKKLVYTSDLTGSEARLLQLKDATFGVDSKVYVDRIDTPLALFYTDGPFEQLDFNPKKGPIPTVAYGESLILLTKKGRFSTEVVGITKTPKVVQEDGDWVLWYFDSDKKIDKEKLEDLTEELTKLQQLVAGGDVVEKEEALKSRLLELDKQRLELTEFIANHP